MNMSLGQLRKQVSRMSGPGVVIPSQIWMLTNNQLLSDDCTVEVEVDGRARLIKDENGNETITTTNK